MAATKSAGNVTLTYNGNAITSYLSQQSLDAVAKAIETTNMASTAVQNTPGLPGWTVNIGGFFDATLHGYFSSDITTPTLRTLVVGIGTVTYTWTTNAFISNFKIDASNPNEAIKWTATLTTSGAPTVASS